MELKTDLYDLSNALVLLSPLVFGLLFYVQAINYDRPKLTRALLGILFVPVAYILLRIIVLYVTNTFFPPEIVIDEEALRYKNSFEFFDFIEIICASTATITLLVIYLVTWYKLSTSQISSLDQFGKKEKNSEFE